MVLETIINLKISVFSWKVVPGTSSQVGGRAWSRERGPPLAQGMEPFLDGPGPNGPEPNVPEPNGNQTGLTATIILNSRFKIYNSK